MTHELTPTGAPPLNPRDGEHATVSCPARSDRRRRSRRRFTGTTSHPSARNILPTLSSAFRRIDRAIECISNGSRDGVRPASWNLIAGCALLIGLAGCGARTGLLSAPEEDAGAADALADAPVLFPCEYAPVGELAPALPDLDGSMEPRLEWGSGRLALAFHSRADAQGVCTMDPAQGLECLRHEELSSSIVSSGDLAWNGESFGLCWGGYLPEEDHRGLFFDRLSPLGARITAPTMIAESEATSCLNLIRVESRYLSIWVEEPVWPPVLGQVMWLDNEGRLEGSAAPDLEPMEWGPAAIDVAAEGERAVLAWGRASSISIRALEGFDRDADVVFDAGLEAGEDVVTLSVALRGPIAGVLWNAQGFGESRLNMVLVDMASGQAGEPVQLDSELATSFGTDLIAVNEGFIAAWAVGVEFPFWWERIVAIPTRTHAGTEIEVRAALTLYDQDSPERSPYPDSPSLAYDGTDAYIAAAVSGETPEIIGPHVHVQRLACHR